ncbi:response regulator [Labilithrix luteola]|nr:response regulator [Labilithrix luteola]
MSHERCGKGATILVVEDDADIRDTMTLVLEGEGFKVETASDGREALDALGRGLRPAIILLDLMMPVMDGWELNDELKRQRDLATIPVVFVSALEPGTRRTASLEGAGFLRKPFELNALLDAVDRAMPDSATAGTPPG